jgi:hypothetical protein
MKMTSKTVMMISLFSLTQNSFAAGLSDIPNLPSMQEIREEILAKVDDADATLEVFKKRMSEESSKNPNLIYGIYKGTSKVRTTANKEVACYALVGIDSTSKKIRDFGIVSNIGPSVAAKTISTGKKLFSKYLPQLTSGQDLDLDMEKEKNDLKNNFYTFKDNTNSMIPRTLKEEKKIREDIAEGASQIQGAKPFLSYGYKASSVISSNASTAVRAGVNLLGINYNLVSISAELSKDDTPLSIAIEGGFGLGTDITMGCKKLELVATDDNDKVESKDQSKEDAKTETSTAEQEEKNDNE